MLFEIKEALGLVVVAGLQRNSDVDAVLRVNIRAHMNVSTHSIQTAVAYPGALTARKRVTIPPAAWRTGSAADAAWWVKAPSRATDSTRWAKSQIVQNVFALIADLPCPSARGSFFEVYPHLPRLRLEKWRRW
jgi:hypothetical protein